MNSNKPLLVGGFVFGGLGLAVAAILLFGGMHLFTRTVRIVAVFQGSVAGLEVGSPVTFRGVNIGKVQRMQVEVDVLNKTGIIPVYMQLEPDKIAWTHGHFSQDATGFEDAVSAGLRAQLRSDSLVTGQLSVDLDFHPGVAGLLTSLSGEEPQIPTMPSDMQDLKEELRALDLRELSEKARGTLAGMQRFLDTANDKTGPLADSLGKTLATVRTALIAVQANSARTFDHVDKLAIEGRGQIATNGRDLDQLLHTAQTTVTQADALLTSMNELTAERSPLRDDLRASVRDLAASAASLRTFTREFERDPARTLLKKAPR
jgi:paraquat-inducible protein B